MIEYYMYNAQTSSLRIIFPFFALGFLATLPRIQNTKLLHIFALSNLHAFSILEACIFPVLANAVSLPPRTSIEVYSTNGTEFTSTHPHPAVQLAWDLSLSRKSKHGNDGIQFNPVESNQLYQLNRKLLHKHDQPPPTQPPGQSRNQVHMINYMGRSN